MIGDDNMEQWRFPESWSPSDHLYNERWDSADSKPTIKIGDPPKNNPKMGKPPNDLS